MLNGELQALWDDYPTMYRELKRLKLTLSKNVYIEYLRQIDKANKDLRDFTHQNIYLEAVRVQRRSRCLINDWKVINAHAASLYRAMVLGTSLICRCGKLHLASLRLDARSRTENEQDPGGISQIKFQFLFLFDGARDEEGGVIGQTNQELEVASVLERDGSTADHTLNQASHRSVSPFKTLYIHALIITDLTWLRRQKLFALHPLCPQPHKSQRQPKDHPNLQVNVLLICATINILASNLKIRSAFS